MSRRRAVVLLSGGLDSAFNLWRAPRDFEVVLAVTFDYGQRAAQSEVRAGRALSERLTIPHKVVELPWFRDFTRTSLVNKAALVPVGREIEIDHTETSVQSAKAVWVPNRNGIFLNIGAAYAEGLGADVLLAGFNAEEAATFPDNSLAFVEASTRSLWFSTANHVQVHSYCINLSKTQIVREALRTDLPLDVIWPCYFSGDDWCGQCESCQRFSRAVREATAGGPPGPEVGP